ncbi:MAG: hypothetical protein GY854_05480 [Deltaproteobacteria bacterium]|nr:hypothetical protein [Deltaproteobacteria bacterium]
MKRLSLTPPATIHLIGICGTGMGALAGLLSTRGFQVTGSDLHAYPPMSTELERLGIDIKEGYRASNLDHDPDLVVVGNVCRRDHPEAEAARERGLVTASMPRTLCDLFLRDMSPLVIAGTHGKTTTASLTAFLLREVGLDPSMLVGGVTADFGSGFRLGSQDWFVVEGDEYDSAYFEKVPKFLSYAPKAAVITSVEYDHIDIYSSFDIYKDAFVSFAKLVPPPGPLAVYGGDPVAVEIARHSPADVVLYGVEGDPLSDRVDWVATPINGDRFQLTIRGEAQGFFEAPLSGRHNLRNILAALVLCHRAAGVALKDLARVLPKFQGVRRRQEVLGKPGGITVYDDFAHHPTAVRETLDALAALHPTGRLLAAFEPRSATACRKLHQEQYADAFGSAGRVVIAPPGRDLPADESLDTRLLASRLIEKGIMATTPGTLEEMIREILEWTRLGDGVVTLSNGSFGGLPRRLLVTLT